NGGAQASLGILEFLRVVAEAVQNGTGAVPKVLPPGGLAGNRLLARPGAWVRHDMPLLVAREPAPGGALPYIPDLPLRLPRTVRIPEPCQRLLQVLFEVLAPEPRGLLARRVRQVANHVGQFEVQRVGVVPVAHAPDYEDLVLSGGSGAQG